MMFENGIFLQKSNFYVKGKATKSFVEDFRTNLTLDCLGSG